MEFIMLILGIAIFSTLVAMTIACERFGGSTP